MFLHLFQSYRISRKTKNCLNLVVFQSCDKKHPDFFPESKVLCNGNFVMCTGGSLDEYSVDLWSGNHPYFQGTSNTVVFDEGQVTRFNRRFAGLEDLADFQTFFEDNDDPC